MTFSSQRLCTFFALCMLLVACSQNSTSDAGQGLVQRLELQPIRDRNLPVSDITIVQRIDLQPSEESLRVKNSAYESFQSTELGEARPALLLTGPKRANINILGRFKPAEFDSIIMTLRCEARPTVQAKFSGRGKRLGQTDKLTIPRKQITTVTIPVRIPDNQLLTKIDLVLAPIHKDVRIFDIALAKTRLGSHLPSPNKGSRLFNLSGDARRSVGISRAIPLEREFTIPENGKLSFEYGWPEIVQNSKGTAHLVVKLRANDEPFFSQRIPLVAEEEPQWRRVKIPLDKHAGKQATLRLSVVKESDAGAKKESVAALVTEPVVFTPEPAPQTVLLITSDTHRFDHLGQAGAGVNVETPFLNGLADRGVFFSNCLTSTNVTLPSHVALLTGTTPRDTGVIKNNVPLTDSAPTLAERYAAQGFQTLGIVAVEHLGDPESNLGQGFDRMAWPSGIFDAEQVVDQLLDWTADLEGRSVFAWIHIFDAHTPYAPPDHSYVDKYYAGDPRDQSLPEPKWPVIGWDRDVRDVDYVRAQYRGAVTYLDAQMGRLFTASRYSKGIIAFTADHGESLGEHRIWWGHGGLYPQTIHVPLIMAWPNGPVGQRQAAPVRQIEVGRTLLDLAGLEHVDFPGRSLTEITDTEAAAPRFALSSAADEASVTIEGWHFVLYLIKPAGRKTQRHSFELFNLKEDPKCLVNLAPQEEQRSAALRELVVDWLIQRPEQDWAGEANLDEDRLAALAELGYVIKAESTETVFFDANCECVHCSPFASN